MALSSALRTSSNAPTFDFHLCLLPIWTNCFRVLTDEFQGENAKMHLIRGVWLFFVATYIVQRRTIIDQDLLGVEVTPPDTNWSDLQTMLNCSGLMSQAFLRTMRSLAASWILRHRKPRIPLSCMEAGDEFTRWTGLGEPRVRPVNIRG